MRGLKKIMSKTVFGATIAKKFKVGDLVEFHQLSSEEKDGIEFGAYETFQGIIVEFYNETLTGRPVCMARILPIKSQIPIEIPCATIKKLRTN